MKLINFNLKEEFIKHFQKRMELLSANYENLRDALLYKESFKTQILPPFTQLIEELSTQDKIEVQINRNNEFAEAQQKSDLEEESADLKELTQDTTILNSCEQTLNSIEAQLFLLREEQKQQQEQFEALSHSMSVLASNLGNVNSILNNNQAQLTIKELTSQKLIEATQAGALAQMMSFALEEQIKKMQCEDGVIARIEHLENQRQHIQETTGVELQQRNAARTWRQSQRTNRHEARKNENTPENLLSPENYKTLQDQIQKDHNQIDRLKKKIQEQAEIIGYALYLQQIAIQLDTPRIQHAPEHIALARIIPKMQNHQSFEASVIHKKDILEKKNSKRAVIVNEYLEQLEKKNQALQTQKVYTKATFFTSGSLATLGVCTLLLSTTPLIVVSASFALLAAASATVAIALHLYQTHKESIISKNIEQIKANEPVKNKEALDPSFVERLRKIDEKVQKINSQIDEHEQQMQIIHESAEKIRLAPSSPTSRPSPLNLSWTETAGLEDELVSERGSVRSNTTMAGRLNFFHSSNTPRLDADVSSIEKDLLGKSV